MVSLMKPVLTVVLLLAGAWFAPSPPDALAAPDEGMWTFDNLPLEQLKANYGFEPTKEWLDHVRMSAIKYDIDQGGGGSASFVSPNGLVMTNHHVALSTVNDLSNAEHDYVRDGFSAKAYGSEPKAPGFKLKQLVETRDLTPQVLEATKDMKDAAEIAKKRAAIGEKAAKEATSKEKRLVAEPVALYDGGELHLYVYRTYDDVRLVFAPEQQIAFFGGDPDNFTYPRYDLDCAFFRVYEDGKPIDSSKHFFKWSKKGAQDGELIFVPGNPGNTQRTLTYAQMEYERDYYNPIIIAHLEIQRDAIAEEMKKSDDRARELRDRFFGVENSLKAFRGHLAGLKDADMMARQKTREAELIEKVADPKVEEAIKAIAEAQKKKGEMFPRLVCCQLPGIVRPQAPTMFQRVVAAAATGGKDPAGEKGIPPLSAMDLAMLEGRLRMAKEFLAPDDPWISLLKLKELTPKAALDRLLASKIFDAAFRAELIKGGRDAVEQSTDPLVAAIRMSQGIVPELAERMDTEVERVEVVHQMTLSQARFKVYGKTRYPDATFTLRLSYGAVKGYESGTTNVPYKTTFNGLYERNAAFDNKPPYHLPKRWFDKRKDLDLSTPLNFVCTADIIGGNSGSPIINRDAEVVGLIFDGNIESLPGNYWYDGRTNRAVGVHSAGIVEALKSVYGEADLAKEIAGS
jgi:V8-like Glu-specific endopeptidase